MHVRRNLQYKHLISQDTRFSIQKILTTKSLTTISLQIKPDVPRAVKTKILSRYEGEERLLSSVLCCPGMSDFICNITIIDITSIGSLPEMIKYIESTTEHSAVTRQGSPLLPTRTLFKVRSNWLSDLVSARCNCGESALNYPFERKWLSGAVQKVARVPWPSPRQGFRPLVLCRAGSRKLSRRWRKPSR